MTTFEVLKQYADRLSADMELDLIISDRYGILEKENASNQKGIINGWHNNPYCLAIKSNEKLWKRCVALKKYRDKKLLENPTPNWHICYCGVAEYVVPVVFNKTLIVEILVTGFKGELPLKLANILSKRTNLPFDELKALHNDLKIITEDITKKLDAYLMPIKELILKIAEETKEEYFFSSDNANNISVQYVKQGLDFINNNFNKGINATSVAKHCNVSLSYLQHLFSQYHSRGVSHEILYQRIEMACYMLKNTKATVREIALKCGFNNVDYFSVAFKKALGITPLKYRNKS
ncbi:MAG: helix-turn-helix domain-containing protein [Ruminococcaceae bacterium]|nr:helix-turn-helix domain-containing protein [Oscillospiraceae bacterium]